MEKVEQPPRKSRVWVFLVATAVALALFLVCSLTLVGDSEVRTTREIQPNVVLSFVLATIALALSIGSNVSAYLNPHSPPVTRILSPIVLLLVVLLGTPTFIALGIAMVG